MRSYIHANTIMHTYSYSRMVHIRERAVRRRALASRGLCVLESLLLGVAVGFKTCFTPAWYHGHGFPTIRYFFMHNSLHTAPRRAQTWPTDPLDGWYSLKLNSTSFRCTRYPSRAPRAPSRIGHDSTLSKGRRASTATAAPGIGAPLRLLQNL